MDIELLYLLIILGVFLVSAAYFKLPIGIAMLLSAFAGILIFSISHPDQFVQIPKHLIDGSFGYIEPVITIAAAMIFMKFVSASGALDAFSVFVLEKFHHKPTILLISFMLILMFPAMITGSSVTSVVSSGALVVPTLLALGIPKKETAAIIVSGSIFGMIAPPINLPVMIIADIVDMPYIGFTLPLLILTVPLAIFTVLFLGRKYVKNVDLTLLKEKIDFSIKERVKFLVYTPMLLLIVLMVLINLFPTFLPPIGLPMVFIIPTILACFVGKRFNAFTTSKEAVRTALPVMAILFGVGMFIQALTLTGARGYVVYNIMSLGQFTLGRHPILLYLGSITLIPAFGAFSPFGSSSVFGGPLVIALIFLNPIIVSSALSMFTGVGDFIPPSVVALHAQQIVEIDKYGIVLKRLIVPIVVTILYTLIYMIFLGTYWNLL
jgi:gluconate:H+ symporter, GntP family